MNRRLLVLISTAAIGLALMFSVACGGDDDDEDGPTATPGGSAEPTQAALPDEVQLTQDDDGSTVQLAGGGTLIVALPSNPSTGFSWTVSETSDPQLELQGDPAYVPPGSTTPVVGAAGTEVFTFRATGTGDARLLLEYRRPFEPGVAPESTFEVTVQIR